MNLPVGYPADDATAPTVAKQKQPLAQIMTVFPDAPPATPDDATDLAAIHVRAWVETFPGLLPPEQIAARNFARQLAQWRGMLAEGRTWVAIIPGLGFAQAGPPRETWLAEGWPEELLSFHVLNAGYGTGAVQALIGAVPVPFSALVLKKRRAFRFCQKPDGRLAGERPVILGTTPITDLLHVWVNGLPRPQGRQTGPNLDETLSKHDAHGLMALDVKLAGLMDGYGEGAEVQTDHSLPVLSLCEVRAG